MKIVLFGGSGQLGKEILERANDLNFELIFPTHRSVDICSQEQVNAFIAKVEPDLVINSAAYTEVDKAEDFKDDAFALNALAPLYIARASKANGARFFQISTDYVFAGDTGKPLNEDSPINPLSVYGKSKLAGEKNVLEEYSENSLIIRTASLHGQFGNNIVHTILKLLNTRQEIKFINDQVSSPTFAGWLAECILDLARIEATGVIHAVCKGEVSWFDFAKKVYEYSLELGLTTNDVNIVPVSETEFPTKAVRPKFSALDVSKLEKLLGREVLSWEVGLKRHMENLKEENFVNV